MGRRKFCLADMIVNCFFHKPRVDRDTRREGARFRGGGSSVTHQSSPWSSSLGGAEGRSTYPVGSPRHLPVPTPVPYRASSYCASRDRPVLRPSPAPRPTRRAAAATVDRRPQAQPYSSSSRCYSRQQQRVGPDTCVVGRDGGGRRGSDVVVGRRRAAVKASSSSSSSNNVFTAGKAVVSDTDIIFDFRAENTLPPPIGTKPAARREVVDERYERKGKHVDVHRAAASSVSPGRRGRRRLKTTRADIPPPPLAVAKASVDPREDFRESMEEMIIAAGKGGIRRDARDLEDLLATYLALNAAEHHGLIVEVFHETWASLAGVNP